MHEAARGTILGRWWPIRLLLSLQLIGFDLFHRLRRAFIAAVWVWQFLWWDSILGAVHHQLLVELIVHAAALSEGDNRAYGSVTLPLILLLLHNGLSVVF